MNRSQILPKIKPLIIVIVLFLLVFSLRAEAVNLSAISDDVKALYQDDSGLPYFSELDSYFNYRMTQDFLDHGYMGDAKINGTSWDLHSYFPPGKEVSYTPLIVYLTAFIYLLVNLFSNVPLTSVAFWTGAFVASLAVIPAYFFIRRITNDYGGITAGLLVGLAPFYFSHTFAGFFDTDMFNMLLPILTVWFFVESLRADNLKNRSIFAVLSAVSMLLFSLAWQGWIYIFYLLIVTVVVYLLVSKYLFGYKTFNKPGDYDSIKEWFTNQPLIFALVVFVVLSSILVIVTSGPSSFASSLLGPLGFTQLQSSVQVASAYPNVYVSVGELQVPDSALSAINNAGGLVVFIFGLLAVFLLFLRLMIGKKEVQTKAKEVESEKTTKTRKKRKKRRRKSKPKTQEKAKETQKKYIIPQLNEFEKKNYLFYAVLMFIWIITTAYLLTKGVRFSELFALPVALSAGIFVGLMLEYIKAYVPNNKLQTVVMVVLIAAAVFAPISSGYAISSSVVPGTSDPMILSLNWIKNNTSPDTVITSWWDYGHLFTAVADRPVTFDGSTQNNLRAYWVGKSLSTNNETLSAGILRMLSTTGDSGPNTVELYTNDTSKSVEILTSILGVDKATATTILTTNYGLTAEQAQNITQYTHPDNPAPNVLITSSDMLGKASWWSYFANWNFQTNNSTGYSYLGGQAMIIPNNETGLSNDTTVLIANNAVFAHITGNNVSAGIINVNELQSQNKSTQQLVNDLITGLQGNSTLIVKPHRLTVMVNDTIVQNDIVNEDAIYSIALVNDKGTLMTYVYSKELEDSMFTKLYIFRGQNLTQFNLAYEQPGVMVWNVV
jgi:dolichyl-diphosphooligosaccharide--protein glycosyltransferase